MTVTKLSEKTINVIVEGVEKQIEYLKKYILNTPIIANRDFKNKNNQKLIEDYIFKYLRQTKYLVNISNITTEADEEIDELVFDIHIIQANKHIYITIKKMIRALEDEIRILINKYSRENISNTPDYILAEYLDNCLVAFEKAVNARTRHNNRNEIIEAEVIEHKHLLRFQYSKADIFVYDKNKIYAAIIQDKIFKYNHSKQVFERFEELWTESYIWCLTNTIHEFADYKSYRDWCIETMHYCDYFKQYNRLFSCKYSNSKNIYVIIKDDIVYRLFVKNNGYAFEDQKNKNFNLFYVSNKHGKSIDCIRKAEAAGYTVLEFQEKSNYEEFLRLFQ